MQGRRVGTDGIERAASFIEQEFGSLGLKAPKGTYRQALQAVTEVRLGEENTLTLSGIPTKIGRDFTPLGFSPSGTFSGSLVFVGYGIRAKSLGYDDYAGLDVTGKIVLAMRYEPGESDENSPFEGSRPSRWSELRSKAKWAHEAGAQALILIDLPRRGDPQSPPPLFRQRGSLDRAPLPVIQLNAEPLLRHLLLRFDYDLMALRDTIDREYRPHSFALPSIEVVGEISIETTQRLTNNIVGVFPGRGALADEIAIVSAHYDHVGLGGKGSRVPDVDAVHNGADANASGVAAMLCGVAGVMDRVKDQPDPRRSLVVSAFSGGAIGNAGAYAYVREPLFPLETTVAIVSLNRVGRLREGGLRMLGVDSAAEWELLMRDPLDASGLDVRAERGETPISDPAPFYAEGIPILQLSTGGHREHRTPDDDPATIDSEGGERIASFLAGVLTELLAHKSRPAYRHSSDASLQFGGSRIATGGAYLGTVPDFTKVSARTGGVALSGATPGSPADIAGVLQGDRIIRMAGIDIPNIEVFTRVLADYQVGERLEFEVQRGSKRLRLWATLGSREGLWSQ